MQDNATSQGRYFTSTPASIGTSSNPQLTFVNGDLTVPDGTTGAGLLIVTGTLTFSGNVSFQGLIFVLGQGDFERNGAGSGNTMGAVVVAKFATSWPSSDNSLSHPFLSPTYNMNGGGSSTTQYDSAQVDSALGLGGLRSMGVREY